ncbi:MAG: hypothetical protein H6573_23870 [Lewinellaceae bacterium]|nr:hypothetical protein [Lewinellaceae bacterium]
MPGPILLTGDKVNFMPAFGAATVVVKPGALAGSGPTLLGGKPVCVVGDEAKVSVPGCTYIAPPYVIPGTGTLKIDSLAGDQKAVKTKVGGKPVLLKGSNFVAVFEVQSQAKQPPPGPGSPIPDPTPKYSGQGSFTTTNIKFIGF